MRKLRITQHSSFEPMSIVDWQAAEDLMAVLVARAYASGHPELFVASKVTAGESSQAASADAGYVGALSGDMRGGLPDDR